MQIIKQLALSYPLPVRTQAMDKGFGKTPAIAINLIAY